MITWKKSALRLDKIYQNSSDLARRQIKNHVQLLVVEETEFKFFPVRRLFDERAGGKMDTPKSDAPEVVRFSHQLRSDGYYAVQETEFRYQSLLNRLSALVENKFQTILSSLPRTFWVKDTPIWSKVMAAFETYDDEGIRDGYGKPKNWKVVHPKTGQDYPAKVIWGYATKKKSGRDFNTREARIGLLDAGFECVDENKFPHSDQSNQMYNEGFESVSQSIRRERSRVARILCIEYFCKQHGGRLICSVCDFDFFQVYGEIGKNFIHVHHLDPLAESKGERSIFPIHDLVPVCPNCHAMIHRGKQD